MGIMPIKYAVSSQQGSRMHPAREMPVLSHWETVDKSCYAPAPVDFK